jgi:hypothetical protein
LTLALTPLSGKSMTPNIATLGRCLRGEMSSDEIEAFEVRPERLLDCPR